MTIRAACFFSVLFLFAGASTTGCPGGSLTVTDDDVQGDDDDAQGDDDDAQGDDDDAQGDDDDAQGDDDDAQGDDDDSQQDDDDSPFAGEYEGEIRLSVDSPQGPMVLDGPLLAIVSATGAVTCNGEAAAPMATVLVEISGEVSGAGDFTGEAFQAPAGTPPQGPYETDGEFSAGGFELRWAGSIPTPDGVEMKFQGSAQGWPL